MSYAIRKDGIGWRAVNSSSDVDSATETFASTPPQSTQAMQEAVKSQQAENNIQKITRNAIPKILAFLATLQNAPQEIKDADASIKSELTKVKTK